MDMRENAFIKALKKVYEGTMYALSSLFRGIKRLFFPQNGERREKIESPTRLIWNSFFRRKTAVIALIILVGLFLFVFIGPLFIPLDVNYTDPLQQNIKPVYSLRRLPDKLKRGIESIDGFSDFTVGLSTRGEVFVWGNSKDALSGSI